MKILIVGWIYEAPPEVRERQLWSPEESLSRSLRSLGHEVSEIGHLRFEPAAARDADVLHVHFLGPGVKVAWRVALTSRVPFVFTKHAPGRPTVKQRAAYFITGLLADAIITHGPNERMTWPRLLRRRLTPITLGANVEAFTRVRRLRRLEEPVRLLYAGSLMPVKRVDLIIGALARLRALGIAVTLTIASHRPTDRESLERLANVLHVGPHVDWQSPATVAELADLYASAHLLLLASEVEGGPGVVQEALMTGLPVVATRVGEVDHRVLGAGVVIDTDATAESIAAGIMVAMEDYPALASGALGRGTMIAAESDPMVVALRHVEVYDRVVGRPEPIGPLSPPGMST